MTGRPLCDLGVRDMSNQLRYEILTWLDVELHHRSKTYIYIICILVT